MKVESYEQWRSVFDEGADARSGHGLTSGKVYQDPTNPNHITVIVEGDLEDMKAYGSSELLLEAESRAGLICDTTLFLDDIT
jgi:hypothetical protein